MQRELEGVLRESRFHDWGVSHGKQLPLRSLTGNQELLLKVGVNPAGRSTRLGHAMGAAMCLDTGLPFLTIAKFHVLHLPGVVQHGGRP